MTKQVFRFRVIANSPPDDPMRKMQDLFAKLNEQVVQVTIEKAKKIRSNNQNNFYHGFVLPCVVQVLESYGNDSDEDVAHDVCKELFLPSEGIRKVKGKKRTFTARSTRRLSTVGWEDYITRIRAWCATEGVIVPLPNEHLYGGKS